MVLLLLTKIDRSKLHTYDDVVERVAQKLNLDDPSNIRLTPHNCYSQQPKPHPIKYRVAEHLLDMLVHYNQRVIHNIRLPKQSTIGDVLSEIKSKVTLSHPDAELRLLEIFPLSEKIENINDQYWTLRAEEIPEEEKNLGPQDRLIHVYHFTKEAAQNQMEGTNIRATLTSNDVIEAESKEKEGYVDNSILLEGIQFLPVEKAINDESIQIDDIDGKGNVSYYDVSLRTLFGNGGTEFRTQPRDDRRSSNNTRRSYQEDKKDKSKGENKKLKEYNRCGDPNHVVHNSPKPPNKDNKKKAFVCDAWSDSGDENGETNEETCLMTLEKNDTISDSTYYSEDNAYDNYDDLKLYPLMKLLNKSAMVEESLNVSFDETPPKSKSQPLVDDDICEVEALEIIESQSHKEPNTLDVFLSIELQD
ncbi:hypothetical protein L1987_42480 [Smallanthus sonchifolius]|uniref:Uncharacterized protein n=1 Tax=Smallanthus sonchifolius TaxID=185202 RepID=A0ACB9GIF9_9ASTR|nr:hypothetical protein L1987_42480 [Smallanthus sonchifolius]